MTCRNASNRTTANAFQRVAFGVLVAVGGSATLASCGPANTNTSWVSKSIRSPEGLPLKTLIPVGQSQAPRKIIGENDLVPVNGDGENIPRKYGAMLNAIGHMSMGCTATHLGNGFVLSAGHCFDAPAQKEEMVDCSSTKVTWGSRRGTKPHLVSRCRMILVQETSNDRDYALFVVDNAPAEKVALASGNARWGTPITMFGHPSGRPLEWSGECELLDPSYGGWSSQAFSHQCDTEPGNSGSAVVDSRTLEIVGIHDGGIAPYNYGTFISNTPIAQFRAYIDGRAEFALPDPSRVHVFQRHQLGHNSQDRVLVEIQGEEPSDRVAVDVSYDVEDGYDFVVIVDGSGVRSEPMTGKGRVAMSDMVAPVSILFNSDKSGNSNQVKVIEID